jgi:hypothetical protein
VNATLRAALEAVWDAAKASPEKVAAERLELGGRKLKLRANVSREDRVAIIEVIDRGPA